jgi:hypothetical protein
VVVSDGPCLFCDRDFKQGDRGTVIGNVDGGGLAQLRWVHVKCLLIEVVGPVQASEVMPDE